jgi:tetratricopeptide (TPR) repeat protein
MGVLFYEIVTGKPPFRGGTPIAAAVRRAKRLAPASSVREKLPRQWDIVIDRCLEYDPEKRFQSAAAVAEALEGKRPSRIRGFAGYAVAASLLIAIAAGTLRLPALKHLSGSAGVQVTPAKTMVVLPFENLGGDPANQAFCDGLQETTTSMLSQAEKLKDTIMIVPSSEVRKDQVKTIADARKVFNASLALTGSVQKSADSLQLTLNLTDVQSMRQRDSRILMVKTNEFASLPQRLASQIDSMLGEGSVLRTQQAAIGETTRDPEAYKLYLQGQGAVRNLKWGAAIDYLQKALARDPNFAPAAGKLAEACVRQYNTSRDTKWLARADLALNESARKEQTPEVRLAQAMIWQATGETSRAVPLFKELLQSEPNNVDIWDLLAQTLKVAGRTAEAEETYQAAVRLRPGYWPAYNTMGVFYEDQNDSQKAEQTFLTGISLAPQVPILHSNLGTLYFGLSRWAEAEREFRRSLALRPNAPGYSNLGTVLFFEGKYVDAAGQDIEATKLQPANHVPWGNLGDARWQIPGERERAREAFQNAYLLASRQIVLNPGDAQLRKSAALYLAKLGRLNEARTEIENAIHQSPKDMYVRFYAARVFAVVGDPKRAETEALASVELGYDSKQVELEPDLKSLQVRQLARAGGKSRAQP